MHDVWIFDSLCFVYLFFNFLWSWDILYLNVWYVHHFYFLNEFCEFLIHHCFITLVDVITFLHGFNNSHECPSRNVLVWRWWWDAHSYVNSVLTTERLLSWPHLCKWIFNKLAAVRETWSATGTSCNNKKFVLSSGWMGFAHVKLKHTVFVRIVMLCFCVRFCWFWGLVSVLLRCFLYLGFLFNLLFLF